MSNEELIEKAKELLYDYDIRYYDELDPVHWITKNNGALENDYCSDCIDKAVYNERRDYLLEQRKLPISLRDEEFSVFDYSCNYGGGYEDDSFATCEICGKSLMVSILPNEQVLEYVLEDLEDGKITDRIGWKAYSLLYNACGDESDISRCDELTLKLAKRVVEILKP